jgi:hypothetical protein
MPTGVVDKFPGPAHKLKGKTQGPEVEGPQWKKSTQRPDGMDENETAEPCPGKTPPRSLDNQQDFYLLGGVGGVPRLMPR